MTCELERSRARYQLSVLQSVLHRPHTIPSGVLQLRDHLLVGALQQERAGERVLNVLHEAVLVLPEGLLVHTACIAQHVRCEVLHAVHRNTSAGQRQSLHVTALGATQCHDAGLGEHVQREWVDSLLVDHNEGLATLGGTDEVLKVDDGANLVVGEFAFGGNELVTLLGGAIDEGGIGFARDDNELFVW